MFTPERIDLHLPESWQQATVQELETIARVIMEESRRVSTFHPFDMSAVKIALFFLLTDIEICAPAQPVVAVEEQYYLCRRSYSVDPWYRKWWRNLRGKSPEPFAIYIHQILNEIKKNLSWLDRPPTVVRFPYPEIRRRGVRFHGPAMLMQDFTWQRYRYASDYISAYAKAENRLLELKKDIKSSRLDLRKQQHQVENYRCLFLATLFNKKIKRMDDETHLVVNDFAYASNQSVDNVRYFRKFKDDQFQVILFWWGGMTLYLQKTYPHCFAKSKIKQAQPNPLELYTRTTATMEKYLGMTEHEVNRQLYSVVFQHLEDMAREAEELEQIRKK